MTNAVGELDVRTARGRIDELAEILHDCVEGGASVSFMWPFDREQALAYWEGVMTALETERCGSMLRFAKARCAEPFSLWLDGPATKNIAATSESFWCIETSAGWVWRATLMLHAEHRQAGSACHCSRSTQ